MKNTYIAIAVVVVAIAVIGFVLGWAYVAYNKGDGTIDPIVDIVDTGDKVVDDQVDGATKDDDGAGDVVVDKDDGGGGGAGILPFKSGVMGRVLMGSTCPVMQNPPDPECADRPYATTVQVIAVGSASSSPFATVTTDKEGAYKAFLPPGSYALQPVGGKPFPYCETKEITVEPDVMQEIDLSCDTGIR